MPTTIRRAVVAHSLRDGAPLLPVRLTVNRRLRIAYVFAPGHLMADRETFFGDDDWGLPGLAYPLDHRTTTR